MCVFCWRYNNDENSLGCGRFLFIYYKSILCGNNASIVTGDERCRAKCCVQQLNLTYFFNFFVNNNNTFSDTEILFLGRFRMLSCVLISDTHEIVLRWAA